MDKETVIRAAKSYLIDRRIEDIHKEIVKEYCKEHNKSEDKIERYITLAFSMGSFFAAPHIETAINYYLNKYQLSTLNYNNTIINIY